MKSNSNKTQSFLILGAALSCLAIGCRSTQSFPDRSAEIQQLDQQRTQAKIDQLDILAPIEYQKFSSSLSDAKDKANKLSDPSKDLDKSTEFYAELLEKSKPTQVVLADMLPVRKEAIETGPSLIQKKEFITLEDDVLDATTKADKGNIKDAQDKHEQFRDRYEALVATSVVEKNLGPVKSELVNLKKKDLDSDAPYTFSRTQEKTQQAEAAIRANRKNPELVENNRAMAASEVERLKAIAADSKRLKSEKSAIELFDNNQRAVAEKLRLENDKKALAAKLNETSNKLTQASSAERQKSKELTATKQSLESAEADSKMQMMLEQRFVDAKSKFRTSEAEVYKDGGNLLIRLKGLNFKKGKAIMPENSSEMMGKLETVLQEFKGASVKVEGHTDATGSHAVNARLSQERADTIKNYLISKNAVDSSKVSSNGVGDEKPIATNKSADGRAQNRRVDVIVSPMVEQSPDSLNR